MPSAALAHRRPSRKPQAATARSRREVDAWPSVHSLMGALIGVPLKSEENVLRLQQRGMPAEAFMRLVDHLPIGVEQIVGERSNSRRHLKAGVLSDFETERALRVARVLTQVIALFDDMGRAKAWVTRPALYVSGQSEVTPLALCTHESGAKIIENRLLETQYGIF